uniref:Fungal lipase-like domain-containing protein n=1 Tax=Panagrolaimus sp. ES5 TaxID=591445 RepID=A0AC34FMG4_9BILA
MLNFVAASFIPPKIIKNTNLAEQCFAKSYYKVKWEQPVHYNIEPCAENISDECQLVIARTVTLNLIVFAFRGTISKDQMHPEADATLLELIPWKYNTSFGKVNKHFFYAAENFWHNNIETYLKTYNDSNFAFTGHSIGGAIASLIALKARHLGLVEANKMTLYTFGEPRIGDLQLAKNFQSLIPESYRVIHYSDIVPHLPLCDGIFSDSCKDNPEKPYHQPQEIW